MFRVMASPTRTSPPTVPVRVMVPLLASARLITSSEVIGSRAMETAGGIRSCGSWVSPMKVSSAAIAKPSVDVG